ncbi:MBL fold metallo-hydrolase [Botrimarina sp.]|uniref:MBL fold metallo-hydrolase n=1 Tax=Botrimarina sp. TaxID=2795802 RepID=UPI0032F005CE
MQIELLGAGGYHPSPRRHTACVFLPEAALALDAGTAAFRLLRRVGEGALGESRRLDVVLTHAHLDHVVGLTHLLGMEHAGEPIETVVHAAPEVLAAIRQHLLAPALFPIQPVTRFEPLADPLRLPGGARVDWFPLDHPGGSLGLRVEHGGKSLAYVTDTRPPSQASIDRVRGVDVLLHEAYFADARRDFAHTTGHCTASQAATVARAAGVGRLVMVHPDPRADEATEAAALAEARRVFSDSQFGHDGQVIEV